MTEIENTTPQYRYQITSTRSGVVGSNERGFCVSCRSQAAAPRASDSPEFVAHAVTPALTGVALGIRGIFFLKKVEEVQL
jgi:hypothetical protein